jgi:hypothetical protein
MPQMKIRLPAALKQWIKKMAERNHRSENSEIVFRLEECKRADSQKENAPTAATVEAFDSK